MGIQRKHFLSTRLFHLWNQLPPKVVDAISVNNHKNEYDSWMESNDVMSSIFIDDTSTMSTK